MVKHSEIKQVKKNEAMCYVELNGHIMKSL